MFLAFSLASFLQILVGSFVLGYLGCAILEVLGFRIKRRAGYWYLVLTRVLSPARHYYRAAYILV
jgi:hypothetical protein